MKYLCANRSRLIKNSLLFFTILFFLSCGISRKSSSNSGGQSPSFMHSFQKGKDSTLYFASELNYHETQTKSHVSIDFTYLKIENTPQNVTCKFTLSSKTKLQFSEVYLMMNEKNYTVDSINKLYTELVKNKYEYRREFQVPDAVFYEWINTPESLLKIGNYQFKPTRRKAFNKRRNILLNSFFLDHLYSE